MSNAMCVKKVKRIHPFTDEERRLRRKILDTGQTMRGIAAAIGIQYQDVSAVVRGKCQSPRYVYEVYKFLGLETPIEITESQ